MKNTLISLVTVTVYVDGQSLKTLSCKLSWSSQAVAVLTHWFCLHVLYTSSLNIANDKNEEMKILHVMTDYFNPIYMPSLIIR